MIINQLISYNRKIYFEKNVQGLANYIQDWKTNEMKTIELKSVHEKYFVNIWLKIILITYAFTASGQNLEILQLMEYKE